MAQFETDVLEALTLDHRTVENLFALYDATGPTDAEAREKVVREIVRELSIHASVEEQLLYPLMRESLTDGDRLVDEALEEHQEVKELLARIDGMDSKDAERDAALRSVMADVRSHVEEEEGEMFPKLRAAVEPSRLVELGRRLDAAKGTAPTRPHPNAPNEGAAATIAGAVAGVVDRIRDGAREGMEEARGEAKEK